jgi:hypothetical protein
VMGSRERMHRAAAVAPRRHLAVIAPPRDRKGR